VSNQHQNPYVDEISEDGYTLKIINATKSSIVGHFDSMHAALNHLHKKGLRVPIPVRNIDGNTWKLENIPVFNKAQIETTSNAESNGELRVKVNQVHKTHFPESRPQS
ncbi:hypothetical protein AVEN_112715-1, partial [Araneus ventricosus]